MYATNIFWPDPPSWNLVTGQQKCSESSGQKRREVYVARKVHLQEATELQISGLFLLSTGTRSKGRGRVSDDKTHLTSSYHHEPATAHCQEHSCSAQQPSPHSENNWNWRTKHILKQFPKCNNHNSWTVTLEFVELYFFATERPL